MDRFEAVKNLPARDVLQIYAVFRASCSMVDRGLPDLAVMPFFGSWLVRRLLKKGWPGIIGIRELFFLWVDPNRPKFNGIFATVGDVRLVDRLRYKGWPVERLVSDVVVCGLAWALVLDKRAVTPEAMWDAREEMADVLGDHTPALLAAANGSEHGADDWRVLAQAVQKVRDRLPSFNNGSFNGLGKATSAFLLALRAQHALAQTENEGGAVGG